MKDPPPSIPYGKQSLDNSDIEAVAQVLATDFLTCGPTVTSFEDALCAYTGAAHAVAVCNGTAALHLALKAAGIGPGDRVITSANTFLASANAAEYVGAITDFADIDPNTLCLSTETLKAAWKPDVKAVVAVDFAGYPCVTKEMADFIHSRGAIIIEDACHAIGGSVSNPLHETQSANTPAKAGTTNASHQVVPPFVVPPLGGSPHDGHHGKTFNKYRIGALPWVDITTFSFHPVKTMTTGEGGAILTNNENRAAACRCLRHHGMIPETNKNTARPYSMQELGFNYRMSDIHCALGISQLQKLDAFVERRRAITAQYMDAFASIPNPPLRPALPYPGQSEAWHLFACRTQQGYCRDTLREQLHQHGIGTQIHYYPVHLQPYYMKKYGYAPGKCPHAETWFSQALSLPLFPAMTEQDTKQVLEALYALST